MNSCETEYSLRLIVRVRRAGNDTPERRHKVVKQVRDWITRSYNQPSTFAVDLCEVRESITVAR
jgi:hypothetical protein